MSNKIAQGAPPPKPEPEENRPAPKPEAGQTPPKPDATTSKPQFYPSTLQSVISMQNALINFAANPIFHNDLLQNLIEHKMKEVDKQANFSSTLKGLSMVGKLVKTTDEMMTPQADGRWGNKTQQGLSGVSHLILGASHLPGGQGLHDIATQIQTEMQAYSDPNKTSQTVSTAATKITSLLNVAKEGMDQLFEKLNQSPYINQHNQSIELKGGPIKLNSASQRIVNSNPNAVLFTISRDFVNDTASEVQVKLSDLLPENFDRFIRDNKIEVAGEDATEPNVKQKLLTHLQQEAQKMSAETRQMPTLQTSR